MAKDKRYCFRSDEDSHLYLVPLELAKKFDNLCVEAYKTDEFYNFNNLFDQYRVGRSLESYSFENLEEIE